jgi:uncharacterized protein (DUF1499 family)
MSPDIAQGLLGVQKDGRLSPCPDMPNCVCSQFPSDQSHTVPPLSFVGTPQSAKEKLKKQVSGMTRATLVVEKEFYLRFEFVSLIWRFVDDVEFLIDKDSQKIHIRSASRVGYSDLGANRSRVEAIREQWLAASR